MKIAPSIYEKTPADFLNQLTRLSFYFSYFQIDIADGIYTPNKTITVEEINKLLDSEFQTTTKMLFDFHLMVNNYEAEIQKIIKLKDKINIGAVLIPYSLHPNYSLLTKNYPTSLGLVLNSEDTVSNLVKDYDIKTIPIIQIMTVHIGAQGNPFLAENLKKIEQLKNAGFPGKIFIDGGINDKTLPQILSQKYQPDVLCVGSYLTKNNDLKNNIFVHDRDQNGYFS